MAVSVQVKILVFSALFTGALRLCRADAEPKKDKEELDAEETKKLEIIKRIKKINEDGSYTIGYEADDGSFKIESRDVLGHIKGTYGFVDEDGQIKRVSYSSTNTTEILSKPEAPSVVQRIPAKSSIPSSYVFTSTQSTPATSSSSSTISQILSRRKTTTHKPNLQESSTSKPKYVTYTSAAPKVLLQGKPSAALSKFNGQISRPETLTSASTEVPKAQKLISAPKPVTEDPEPDNRGNILRRELPENEASPYSAREHIFTLQQSLGHDSVDVYSGSMTTGTARPLFTTTARSRPAYSTVPTATTSRPSIAPPYPLNYLKNSLQDIESSNDYVRETTTLPASPTPVAASQIPSSRPEVQQEPLVAIRQPNQRNTILIPLSQFQGRIIPIEQYREPNEESRNYPYQAQTSRKPPMVVEIDQTAAVVRRLPPHPLRPMPVQVDENGYLRELPRHVPTPYPVPVPASQIPKYANPAYDVDNIEPPVSTKDFQRLLQQLILRQSRLEKISALTKQPPEMFVQPEPAGYRQVYSQPFYYQQEPARSGYNRKQDDRRRFHHRPDVYEEYDSESYRPSRRVARLLPSGAAHQEAEEYLPSDVREMLLLRMLQLAINPALPLDEDEVEIVAKSKPVKRTPVRNVEILGEDETGEEKGNAPRG
ncbi:unnamed protein product [Phyllotreta striolata]|uniref:Uncharacterized protein n=1 Tax=Phyllotreta striolata TaxID=444603 RepID=A0A9N9TBL2_PHYSR|nr:unnamed protein product [Phyllotreta striolata]